MPANGPIRDADCRIGPRSQVTLNTALLSSERMLQLQGTLFPQRYG